MKSALFVDFDNIYSGLARVDKTSAERFARHPMQWMNWVVQSLELPEHVPAGSKRRLLVRRCYLNPQVYQQFRPFFNIAGFEIIDCPALTNGGKTSTDIHMVLDMVDLLLHEAHYDEFIVFSADADFTPVLRKLRRWDRRTTVLAIGFPSAAYRASADLVIDQDEFVRGALAIGEADEPPKEKPAPAVEAEPVRPLRQDEAAGVPATLVLMGSVAELIRQEVGDALEPVPCAKIASTISRNFTGIAPNWNGKGSFRRYIESLELAPLALDWNSHGGYVYDPARHALSADGQSTDDWPDAHCLAVARQIHEVTGVPLLSRQTYRLVFEAVAREADAHSFDFIESGKRIRDSCREAGGQVSRADVTFVLRGLLFRGHKFEERPNSPDELGKTFANNVRSLCLREQIVLDTATEAAIRHWFGGRE